MTTSFASAVSPSPAPAATSWPPPCPVCRGARSAPEVPGSEEFCEACQAEGTAVEWTCAGCGTAIDTEERPAEIREHAGKVSYTCGDCAGAPSLPGIEEACPICGAAVDEHGMAPDPSLPLSAPGGRRDLAAEAVAIARGDLAIRPEREHVVELLRLLELRQAAIAQLTGGAPAEARS